MAFALAGLWNEPPPQPQAPPGCSDSISSGNILNHVVELSRQPSRELSSRGAAEAARYIAGCLSGAGWDVFMERFDVDIGEGVSTVTNVEAELPGGGTDSILVLCTHYDSRAESPGGHAPGADDNASGAAVLIEVARILSLEARRAEGALPVKMVFFGGEEDSMLGSTRFANRLAADPAAVIGVINIDMIGYDREGPKDFVIFTDTASSGLARRLERCADGIAALRYETTVTDYANSDHGPFWRRGFRAVSIWEGYDHNPYYHTALDTADKLSPSFMSDIACVLLCAVVHLIHAHPLSSPR